MNWMIEEAKKADPDKDVIKLENPEAIKQLDSILLDTYLPTIKKTLKKSDFPFSIFDDSIKSGSHGEGLTRELGFMIFNDLNFPFFTGTISRSRNGYFFEKVFSLGLSEKTPPEYLFRILNEKRFSGMPPEMTIEGKSTIFPDWDIYYHIKISNGKGLTQTGFSGYDLDKLALREIKTAINDSIKMYHHSMIDGFYSMNDVKDFLNTAFRIFDAY